MNRNRLIQLLCVFLAAVGLAGAAVMVPMINGQRRDLRIASATESGNDIPAKYAIATTVLGPFRGLFVDTLWYRAEHLKRAGKFFEANTLANWITTLQPRFPQVWLFNAWNMAYNISVATHTPKERWDWVSKGIHLLREQGLRYNPNALPLYRELAWMFFHKVGGFSDNMNWYYKQQMAQRWQELLGHPTDGVTTPQAIDRFKPIARAADRYFRFDRPSIATAAALHKLMDRPGMSRIERDRINTMLQMGVVDLDHHLASLAKSVRGREPGLADRLTKLRQTVQKREARAFHEPLTLLYKDAPGTRPLVKKLRGLGYDPDTEALRAIGRVRMVLEYAGPRFVRANAGHLLTLRQQKLLPLVRDQGGSAAMKTLVAYLRAQALVRDYNMDPAVMLDLMKRYGPLDWRHPDAHAVYWGYMGVVRSGQLRNDTKIDLLNTNRRIIQSLQDLVNYGRITYNPLTGHIDMLPDPRFLDAYGKALDYARNQLKTGQFHSGVKDAFKTGYENFLAKAIEFSYFYGDPKQAQRYYDKARKLFGNTARNKRSGRYNLSLPDLVLTFMQENQSGQGLNRAFIDSLLQRAFTQGLGDHRPGVFNRMISVAKAAHAKYQKARDFKVPTAARDRQALPPFGDMVVESYASFMREANVPMSQRIGIYQSTPPSLRRRAYPRFRGSVREQARARGIDFAAAFPPPPGLKKEQTQEEKPHKPKGSGTVERK